MANKIDTIERDGKTIIVYDNGMERDAGTGHIVKPPPHTLISREKATEYHRLRREKTQAAVRKAMIEAHNANMPNQANTSPEAFAGFVGMLIEQVLLNSEAYPRDRIELLKELGRVSGLATSEKLPEEDGTAAAVQLAAGAASVRAAQLIADVLKDVLRFQENQPEVIPGKVVQ